MPRPSRFSGHVARTIAAFMLMMAAAPMPWNMRAAMMPPSECDSAQASDPATNSSTPGRYTR